MRAWILGTAVVGFLNPTAVFAAGNDELWEITSKTEMKGMPVSVPPQKMRICVPKGQATDPQRSMAAEDPNRKCKVSDVKTSGNKTSWKMRCEPPNEVISIGEMTYSADSYHQVVKTVSNMSGHKMEMNQVVDGKRVGTCQAKK